MHWVVVLGGACREAEKGCSGKPWVGVSCIFHSQHGVGGRFWTATKSLLRRSREKLVLGLNVAGIASSLYLFKVATAARPILAVAWYHSVGSIVP